MDTNEIYITDNKKTENTQSNKNKKENLIDIKQSLFQELTTQSSRKIKHRDNDESSYKNSKYINYFNFKNIEDNSIPDIILSKKEKENNKINETEKKTYNKLYKKAEYDINNLMNSNSQIQIKNLFNNSNHYINIDNFNNNDDLMYILTTNKNNDNDIKERETEDESDTDNYYKKSSHIALPFCHYHKYNIKLPKIYTCNFKKCSCCGIPDGINVISNYDNDSYNYKYNNNKYRNSKYSSNEKYNNKYKNSKILNKIKDYKKNKNSKISNNDKDKEKYNKNIKDFRNIINENKNYKATKYKSVLGELKNKNINNKLNKSKITESSESNPISEIEFNFQKPNNINLKIPKNDFNDDISEKEKEFENSIDESSKLELPDDFNIDDEKDLKNYKNLVNKSEKKPTTHFSILYYKRLNKSYNQVFSNDLQGPIKVKNFEFLRE